MPKQRKRIVFCDCLDCVSRKNDPYPSDAALAASEAAARQQPPPKALLIVGSGLVQTRGGDMAGPMNTLDEIRLPHLDQLVREGHTGLLASRSQRPAGLSPCIWELAQLLGVSAELTAACGTEAQPAASGAAQGPSSAAASSSCNDPSAAPAAHCGAPQAAAAAAPVGPGPCCLGAALQGAQLQSLQQRFQGMQVAFSSNCPDAGLLAAAMGMAVSPVLDPGPRVAAPAGEAAAAAEKLEALQLEQLAEGAATDGAAAAAAPAASSVVGLGLLPPAADAAQRIVDVLAPLRGEAGVDLLMVHLDLATMLQRAAASTGPDDAQAGTAATSGLTAFAASFTAGRGDSLDGAPSLAADERPSAPSAWQLSLAALRWLDELIRQLNEQPGVRGSVLTTLVLTSQGQALGKDLLQCGGSSIDTNATFVAPPAAGGAGQGDPLFGLPPALLQSQHDGVPHGAAQMPDHPAPPRALPMLRPPQSFEFCGSERVAVDCDAPLLMARRLPGVIRRDRAQALGLRECQLRGGVGPILVDRLLHELAYKLARAPKYGS